MSLIEVEVAQAEATLIEVLPYEILAIIFNKLKQEEVLKLRFVCKRWNEAIKDSYNFAIILNEDSPGLEFVLQRYIAKLTVRKLVQSRIQIFPVEAVPTDGRLSRSRKAEQRKLTFRHPDRIRRIKLLGYSSAITRSYLKQLLQLCQKNLSHLRISLRCSPEISKDGFTFKSLIFFKFQNLTRLDLDLNLNIEFESLDPWRSSFLAQLEASEFPKLRSLKVTLHHEDNIDDDELVSGLKEVRRALAFAFLLRLLTKNPKGLKRLGIVLSGFYNIPSPEGSGNELTQSELSSLKSITDLQQLLLDFDLDTTVASINMYQSLLELISRQRKLEMISTNYKLACKESLLRTIILYNHETIVHVLIESLSNDGDHPFDISVFKNCHNLKQLGLSSMVHRAGLGPELNCGSFPESLQSLLLIGFRILSKDIFSLLNSKLMLTLQELALVNCGVSGTCGINYASLRKVEGLKKRKLQLQSLRLKAFNPTGPKQVEEKMESILNRLGNKGTWALYSKLWLVRDNDSNCLINAMHPNVPKPRLFREAKKVGCVWDDWNDVSPYRNSDDADTSGSDYE